MNNNFIDSDLQDENLDFGPLASDSVSDPEPVAAALLIHAFPDHQVSKNFRLSEFRPGEHSYASDSATAPVLIRLSPALVNILEDIREKAGGKTLHITSAYRPLAYNRKVGGVSNSTHIANEVLPPRFRRPRRSGLLSYTRIHTRQSEEVSSTLVTFI